MTRASVTTTAANRSDWPVVQLGSLRTHKLGPPQQLRLRSTLAVPLCTLAVALYGTESTTELSPTNAGPSTISRSPEESRLRQQSQSPASSRSRRKQGMQGQQSVTGRRTVCDVRAATYGQGSVDGVCQVDLPSANSNSTEPCTVAQPNFVPKQHNDSGSNGPLQDERWAKRCASSAPGASTRVRTRGMHARCTSKPTGGCMRHSAGLVRQWMWATQGPSPWIPEPRPCAIRCMLQPAGSIGFGNERLHAAHVAPTLSTKNALSEI